MATIRKTFLSELGATLSTDQKLTSGDSDMVYAFETQKKRIASKGLLLDYDFDPRGLNAEGRDHPNIWSDDKYVANMSSGTCTFRRTLKRGNKTVSQKKLPANVWLMITDVKNGEHVGDDIYVCPNCGTPSPIKELITGCHSCGTQFKMDDLYPKVTNYNIVRDYSMGKSEVFPKLILPGILIGLGVGILSFIFLIIAGIIYVGSTLNGGNSEGADMAFGMLFMFAGSAPVYGFLAAGAFIFGRLIVDVIKAMPLLDAQKTRTLFENTMKPYGPEYIPDFFIGRTMGKLKTIIFSEDPGKLPFYKGAELPADAKNMVDILFRGAFRFDKVEVQDNKAVVEGEAYTEVLYDNGKTANRNIGVRLVKDVSNKHGIDFLISNYQCPTCAGSFNAYENKFCPFCGNAYDMEKDDWVIEYIK